MNSNSSGFRRNRAKDKAPLLLPALLLCAPLLAGGLWGQSSAGFTSATSDPSALAVVTKALTAMGGGANWQSIGAASTEVSLSRPGEASRTIQWADDWHLGYGLSRRDSSEPNGRTATMIALRDRRFRSETGGAAQNLRRENDLAVLAVGYPAAALMLSLKRNGCSFHSVRSSGYRLEAASETGNPTVEEDCKDAFFPAMARMTWAFSASTGLPMQVRLPVRLLLHDGIAYETARFDQFSGQGNVLAPSEVTVVLPTGQTEELQIGRRSFAPSLPDSTFARP